MKQPVTAAEINAIRGLTSTGPLDTLKKRKLIAVVSNPPRVAKSIHWQTTREFLNEFGLANLDEIYAVGKLERVFGSVFGLVGYDMDAPDT